MKTSVNQIMSRDLQHGFTLIEVLVAVVVFSFGMLGIAGMMTISVRNNHNGYLRTQANFLAENMLDRMRANPTAVWGGAYAGVAADGTADCTLAAPCNYTQLAAYDMQNWARTVTQFLPNSLGTITCVANGALLVTIQPANPPSIWFPAPPYDGICTINVQWTESDEASGNTAQTLTLVGTP